MRLFSDVPSQVHDPWLARAMTLAEQGRGMTSPNPPVGCVLVRDGVPVGEGFHSRAGGPHAEAVALAAAGDAARGSTAYVTLEPCTHHGRTPPCVGALLDAGVERAVIGMPDPNTGVSGGGAEALRTAGVDVDFAEDPEPFEDLVAEWTSYIASGLPHIRVKIALTLDGHPTIAQGVRSSLTGEEALELTMRLRSRSDAVMVGVGTATVDDPALTVRGPDGAAAARQPVRVVLTRTDQPSSAARMFNDGLGKVIVLVPEESEADPVLESVAEIVRYPIADGIRGALRQLAGRGIVSLLVEAGPRLLSALWEEDLVDDMVLYHAGGMAGSGAPELFAGDSQEDPASLVRRMRAVEAGLAGNDAVTVWRRSTGPDR